MSEFFVYDSDNSCDEFSIQSTESKKGDDTIEDTAPKSVHDNVLKLPVSHNSGVSSLVNTISSKS